MDNYVEIDSLTGVETNISNLDFNESILDTTSMEEEYIPLGVEHLKLIVLSAMFSLSIVSNGCSIVAIVNRKQKLTRMYFFLLHLSIADILTAFSSLLPELVWTATSAPNFNGGDALCRILKFVQMVAPYLSSYMLVMIAMDRFQAVCYPMTNRMWKPSQSNLKIFAAWTIALVLCIPHGLVFGEKDNSEKDKSSQLTCSPNLGTYDSGGPQIYVTWFALTSFIIPLMALSFYYARICSKIRENLRTKDLDKERSLKYSGMATQKTTSSDNRSKDLELAAELNSSLCMKIRRWGYEKASRLPFSHEDVIGEEHFRPRAHSVECISRAKIKSVKQTIVIIVSYVLCSTPAVGFQLWAIWVEKREDLAAGFLIIQTFLVFNSENSTEWFFWLVTLNSILNPWIYITLDAELQRSLALSCCPRMQGRFAANPRVERLTSVDDSSRIRRKKKISESSNSVTFNNTKLSTTVPPPRNALSSIPRPRSFTIPTRDSGPIILPGLRTDPCQCPPRNCKEQNPHSDLRALYYQQRSRQKRRLPLPVASQITIEKSSEAPMRNRTNTFQL